MNNLVKTLIVILLLHSSFFASNPIKITLIKRISQFIQWPKLTDQFIIGIYKDELLKKDMEVEYKNKTIQKLPIKIYNIQNQNDSRIKDVNLIYFTKELSGEVDTIFKKINKFPILVVTEFPNDVYEGMHLGLYYDNQKIKFLINQDALQKVNLKASYKILQLAKIVKAEK